MGQQDGGLAQLVARMLSMHEVAGSIPAISILLNLLCSGLEQVNIYLFERGAFYHCQPVPAEKIEIEN
jgi:hypothetical protein